MLILQQRVILETLEDYATLCLLYQDQNYYLSVGSQKTLLTTVSKFKLSPQLCYFKNAQVCLVLFQIPDTPFQVYFEESRVAVLDILNSIFRYIHKEYDPMTNEDFLLRDCLTQLPKKSKEPMPPPLSFLSAPMVTQVPNRFFNHFY